MDLFKQLLKSQWKKIALVTIAYLSAIFLIKNTTCLIFLGIYCSRDAIFSHTFFIITLSAIPLLVIVCPVYLLSRYDSIEIPNRKFRLMPRGKITTFLTPDWRKITILSFFIIILWSFLDAFFAECYGITNETSCIFANYPRVQAFILHELNEKYRYLDGLSIWMFYGYLLSCSLVSVWSKAKDINYK